jgi:hypothetical protein
MTPMTRPIQPTHASHARLPVTVNLVNSVTTDTAHPGKVALLNLASRTAVKKVNFAMTISFVNLSSKNVKPVHKAANVTL